RDDQQRREDADEDDARRDAAADDAVARLRLRRQLPALDRAVDQTSDDERDQEDHADDDQTMPERHAPLFDGPAKPLAGALETPDAVEGAGDDVCAGRRQLGDGAAAPPPPAP